MERRQGNTRDYHCCCAPGLSDATAPHNHPASTQAADEAAVRQTDENWSKAAQSKKVDDWVAFYSDDAVILPPNDKKASGKEDVRKIHWCSC